MTGFFKYFTDITKDSEHDSVRFDFKDGTFLAYDSTRKLGRVLLIRDDSAFLQEKNLGVDLLDPELTEERFVDLLSSRRGMIKSQLMNQALLAGLGNIYSDEVLFQAGIHPRTRIQNLTSGDLQRLYQVMHKVIAAAVKHKANPEQLPDWFFLPRRHVGGRCPVCGCELSTVLVSGRRGYVCTRCQPLKQKAP
jgi:formamidopyrimidine-DNA glycosylase